MPHGRRHLPSRRAWKLLEEACFGYLELFVPLNKDRQLSFRQDSVVTLGQARNQLAVPLYAALAVDNPVRRRSDRCRHGAIFMEPEMRQGLP
jgi:hypothetical protein